MHCYSCLFVVSDCTLVHAQCIECTAETANTCTTCNDGWFEDSGSCTRK